MVGSAADLLNQDAVEFTLTEVLPLPGDCP